MGRGLTTSWFAGLLRLTRAEFSRMVRAPSSLYFFLGTIGFLGFIYWLTCVWAVALFVDFAYVTLPVFFLAIGSTLISRERESGFSGILFTHPIDSSQHYAAKLLSLELLAGLYLLALVPFDLQIVYFGGPGWIGEILMRVGWTLLTAFFVGALGLLVSASLGRRATLPSVSLGFAAAMILVFGPFLFVQYLSALDSSVVPTVLALLHVSPVMGAMDLFHSYSLVLTEPLLVPLVTGSLAVFLALAGFLVYARFQSPEGWEASAGMRAGIPILVLAVLIVTPLAVPFAYEYPEASGGSNSVPFGDLLLYIGGFSPGAVGIRVGDAFDALLNISLSNSGSAPVTVDKLGLSWRSDYFEFNVSSADLGPFGVLPVVLGEEVHIAVPVHITALRVAALGSSEYLGFTPIVIGIQGEAQGATLTYQYDDLSLHAVGPDYNRDVAWLVVGFLALAALGLRSLGRVRRRKM